MNNINKILNFSFDLFQLFCHRLYQYVTRTTNQFRKGILLKKTFMHASKIRAGFPCKQLTDQLDKTAVGTEDMCGDHRPIY